jgi:plasmid replication initiation protein
MKSDLTKRNYTRQSHVLVNARTALSKSEIDIILILMTAISIEDKDFKDYEFSIKELEERMGHKLQSQQLKKIVKSLMSKPIEFPLEIDGEWEIFNWFSYFKYGSDGLITCRFDKFLKPFMLDLKKRFVIGDLRMLLPMKSGYSKRIYLLLKEYAKLGRRTFNVKELQEMLKVPDGMKRFDNFKRQILKRAEADINKFTDLEVTLSEKKRGKKVIEVTYHIRKNQIDLKSFISIIREMYVNRLLYHTTDGRPLKCSEKGLLYYADINDNINKRDSQKLWEYLHEHREHLECYEKFDEKEAIKRLVLADEYSFIKYMREKFTNKDIFRTMNEKSNKEMLISISFTGDLYDKVTGDYFERVESLNLWNKMYRLAKRGEIELF